MDESPSEPLDVGTLLERAVRRRCLACGEGPAFETWLRMHERCPACGFRFAREGGYFLGAIYFNYGATALVNMVGFFGLWYALDLSVWQLTAIWCGIGLSFPFWFHPYSRQLWMVLDLACDPPKEKDFTPLPGE